jgi:hypothetical protein
VLFPPLARRMSLLDTTRNCILVAAATLMDRQRQASAKQRVEGYRVGCAMSEASGCKVGGVRPSVKSGGGGQSEQGGLVHGDYFWFCGSSGGLAGLCWAAASGQRTTTKRRCLPQVTSR